MVIVADYLVSYRISSRNGCLRNVFIVNGMGTFEIAKGTASVTTEPTGLENLPYNGTEQALIEAGTASNGMMVYSLSETGEYTPAIPTGKDVDNYTVWYKAQGDGNHNDSEAQSVTASIAKNTVIAPTIQVTPEYSRRYWPGRYRPSKSLSHRCLWSPAGWWCHRSRPAPVCR